MSFVPLNHSCFLESFYAFPYLSRQPWATKQSTTVECEVAIKSKRKFFCTFEQYSLSYITAEMEQAIEFKIYI